MDLGLVIIDRVCWFKKKEREKQRIEKLMEKQNT